MINEITICLEETETKTETETTGMIWSFIVTQELHVTGKLQASLYYDSWSL